MLPTACFVVWAITFVGLGIYSLSEDYSLKDKDMPCGKYHVWKYVMLNTVLQCFVFVTYFVIAGGGEGARARAMVCVLFHFAFAVWGLLLWHALDEPCSRELRDHYKTLYAFFHICVVSNLVSFGLFFSHEVYLGPKMGVDLTLMPEIHYAVIQRPPTEHIPRLSDPGSPDDGFFPHQPPGLVRMPDGKSADKNNADDAVLNIQRPMLPASTNVNFTHVGHGHFNNA